MIFRWKSFYWAKSCIAGVTAAFQAIGNFGALMCELTKIQYIPVFNNLSPSPVRKSSKGSAAPRGTSSHSLSIDTLLSIDTRLSVCTSRFFRQVRCPKSLLYLSHQPMHNFPQFIPGLQLKWKLEEILTYLTESRVKHSTSLTGHPFLRQNGSIYTANVS